MSNWDVYTTADETFGTNLTDAHEGIKSAVDEKITEFDQADGLGKAEMTAEATGYVMVMIVDAVYGNKCTSKLSKAAKMSKLGRAARASKVGQGIAKLTNKAETLAELLKTAAKNKAKRTYDKLKNVVKGVFRARKRPRCLKYKPTSEAILEAIRGKTTTIIGNYQDDMRHIVDELGNVKSFDFGPKEGGFNILNVPDEEFTRLGKEKFWKTHNEPWLQQAVNRDDIIKVATEPTYDKLYRIDKVTGEKELTGFGREYEYLKNKGYSYDPSTREMIKNKK